MRAHLSTADQFYEWQGPISLTPRGVSDESEKLRQAEEASLFYYISLPASRLHLHEGDDHKAILRVARQELRDMLSVSRNRLTESTREQIQQRVDVLLDPIEWDLEDSLPNTESFRRLLSFLSDNTNLRYPSIFLNRYGLFTASWRPEKRKLASLVFHSNGCVNWLVFLPREDDESEVIESAGRAPLDAVLEQVGKHGALSWMRRPTLLGRIFGKH